MTRETNRGRRLMPSGARQTPTLADKLFAEAARRGDKSSMAYWRRERRQERGR